MQTFEAGGKPGWQERYPADFKKGMIDRSVLVKELQEVVGGTNGKYVMIEGATTAVRQAVSGMQGAVYFMCPADAAEFSMKLCQALGVRSGMVDLEAALTRRLHGISKQEPSASLEGEPRATWVRLRRALEVVAQDYLIIKSTDAP